MYKANARLNAHSAVAEQQSTELGALANISLDDLIPGSPYKFSYTT